MQNTGNHLNTNYNPGNQKEESQFNERWQHHHHQESSTSEYRQESQQLQSPQFLTPSCREKRLKVERDGAVMARRCLDPPKCSLETVELSRKMPGSSSALIGCAYARSSGNKEGERGKNSTRIDMNTKLERSRQSARECRARKKLRYQYLEDLVNKREKAVFSLHIEIDKYKDWCNQVDDGAYPNEAFTALHLDKKSNHHKPT